MELVMDVSEMVVTDADIEASQPTASVFCSGGFCSQGPICVTQIACTARPTCP